MQDEFTTAARKATERFLTELGIAYAPQADGSLFIAGCLDLSNKELAALPDLSMVDVNEDFFCSNNQLKDLTGAPRSVGGAMDCSNSELVSLKGAPRECLQFDCSGNRLLNLEGGPESAKEYYCEKNPLHSLEHAPRNFTRLESPFGSFNAWSEVPVNIRLAPDTRQRLIEEAVRNVTTLNTPLRVGRALKFCR